MGLATSRNSKNVTPLNFTYEDIDPQHKEEQTTISRLKKFSTNNPTPEKRSPRVVLPDPNPRKMLETNKKNLHPSELRKFLVRKIEKIDRNELTQS